MFFFLDLLCRDMYDAADAMVQDQQRVKSKAALGSRAALNAPLPSKKVVQEHPGSRIWAPRMAQGSRAALNAPFATHKDVFSVDHVADIKSRAAENLRSAAIVLLQHGNSLPAFPASTKAPASTDALGEFVDHWMSIEAILKNASKRCNNAERVALYAIFQTKVHHILTDVYASRL